MTQNNPPPTADLHRTGVTGLDDVLGGGLSSNRLYLVEGDPGSGKTTLGLQFLVEGVRAGQSAVYVSLAETRDELAQIARSHDMDISGIQLIEQTPDESAIAGDAESTMFHVSDVELAETTRAMLRQVDELRPQRLVIDSLSEMRLLAQNPLRYRRQILALKQYFAGRACTVLMLDDRTSTVTDLQLQSIAHGVIALERRSPDYGVMQRRLQVLKMRGKPFSAGYHDYVIEHGGLRVFPRVVAVNGGAQHAGGLLPSGLTALDALLGGGIERGTSVLLAGQPGTGKSTLGVQFATAAARRGEKAALFLFDESPRTLLARSAGMALGLHQEVEARRIHLEKINPGAISAGEFMHRVRLQAESGTRVLVIDSLNGYLNATPDARFLNLQLHEMLTWLGNLGVTTFVVVAQHGLAVQGQQAPVDASYLADTVVLLRFFEAGGHVRQAVSVIKKRAGAHERTIREYQFGRGGIVIGPALSEFEGVLTGAPRYTGRKSPLLKEGVNGG